MAPGLPDRVDCTRLAQEAAALERVYPLSELPRLQDLLADAQGSVHAKFAFANCSSGRAGAAVEVWAEPNLVCQRCLQGFACAVTGRSEIEFANDADAAADSDRELYVMDDGLVSLRELAEEEILLGLPIIAACSAPETCGRSPNASLDTEPVRSPNDRSRPFAALQDLLKKT